jgi:predicted PurR-regulated permease PerM
MGEAFANWDANTFQNRLSMLTNGLLLAALVIIAMATLEDVLKPFFIALGIYFILKPGADILSEGGKFPVFLSYLTMFMLFLLIIVSTFFFAWAQTQSIIGDEDKINRYNNQLNDRYVDMKDWAVFGMVLPETADNITDGQSVLASDLTQMGFLDEGDKVMDLAVEMLSGFGMIISTSVTVLFFLIFIILEASFLPGRIERAWPGKAFDKVNIVRHQIEESVNTYIIVKTGCGLGTAAIAGLIMWYFGVDLWFVWAILTFILNYVPYIGSLIATVPPILVGFVILTPFPLLMLVVLLLLNQQIWGNVIETKWAGKALDLSPVILLIVTAFSFWLWGIVGMILSVPFIVIIKIVLENIEATRPLAILLSERAPTLEEAWADALKDGRLSFSENHKLHELQKLLGVSDAVMTSTAGRIAASMTIKRQKVNKLQLELIEKSAAVISLENSLNELVVGKLDRTLKPALKQLIERLEEEE